MEDKFKNLEELGWNEKFQEEFEDNSNENSIQARIFRAERDNYWIHTSSGDYQAKVSGKFRHEAVGKGDFPAVGDWVVVNMDETDSLAVIHKVLKRKSKFSRKVAGEKTDEQVLVSNIDYSFIVCGLDNDFNLRRIERYLTLTWSSGSIPVIILNKADLCDDSNSCVEDVEDIAIGVPVHTMSAKDNLGLDIFQKYLKDGKTAVLLGSSGVGKSSIINTLMGNDILKTDSVREDDSRGRHTTTSRQMYKIPSGGLLIDTPGLRELQIWVEDEDDVKNVFNDIDEIAQNCRFDDCEHETEPGCAVKEALESGEIDQKRFQSYLKLKREAHFNKEKQDKKLNIIEREKWKGVSKLVKDMKKKGSLKR